MKPIASTILAALILITTANAQLAERVEPPSDFKGDGCSLFPDGNYRECCYLHDLDYFRGGSGKERKASDKRLYRCVRSKKGWQNEIAAPIMLLGVRLLGDSWMPAGFRWGFGQKKRKR